MAARTYRDWAQANHRVAARTLSDALVVVTRSATRGGKIDHQVRTWVGFVYVASILDEFAQKIVAWNVAPTKAVELVDVPLRTALWQCEREGQPRCPAS